MHAREVEGTLIQYIIQTEKQGYYTQGDDDIERRYNNSSEENISLNNNRLTVMNQMPAINQMLDIQQILASDKKRPPFPV